MAMAMPMPMAGIPCIPLDCVDGCLLLLLDVYMATLIKSPQPPHFLPICLTLFFIFLLLRNPTINPSADTRRLRLRLRLLLDTSSEPTSSTVNINQTPKPHTSSSSSSSRRQFGAAAHEVPSGPNPISNR
ncbi:hypothetical protein V6N12_058787 [Hibiscus sabdariffa]|uniref:Uncharacterized protein n=1 Tax=Hibiscus sabdariffa TaxID=183260 RepID=A0ABR2EVY4_9ROSI